MTGRLKTRRSKAVPRWGWTGFLPVPHLEDLAPKARAIVRRLPVRRSTIAALTEELLSLGGQYLRFARQDELGPTRAEQLAALREVVARIGDLQAQLAGVPKEVGAELDGAFEPIERPSSSRADQFHYDMAVCNRIMDAADRSKIRYERKHPTQNLHALAALAESAHVTAHHIIVLDTTTNASLFDAALRETSRTFLPEPARGQLSDAKKCLTRLSRRAASVARRLEGRHGPDRAVSVRWLVAELAEFWRREVRTSRVTSGCLGRSRGRPATPAGQFLMDCFDLFASTVPVEEPKTVRGKILIGGNREARLGLIDRAVREYVRSRPRETNRGPARKRQ